MKQFLLFAALLAAGVFALIEMGKVEKLQEEKDRLSVELVHAYIPLQRDTIHDSIEVVTQTVVEVVPKKMKEAMAADRQTISDLKLRVKQLEAMQTTTLQTIDTVTAHHKPAYNLYYYSDQWADIRLSLDDTTFYYNIRDSLSTIVYREYKHRFLWWKWGTKGYRLKIVNFNPHTHVTYNKYIRARK